jgi:1-acyl-sn-glycerol-3-phosphate acyltransferase
VALSDGFPLDSYSLLRVERRGKLEESFGLARAVPAYILSFSCAALMCLTMVLSFPFVKMLDPIKRVWTDKCNMFWARVTALPIFAVRVVNPENLPQKGDGRSYVYISNHQSFADIIAMYFLGRSFKWVSKASIKKIPIIGWAMTLTGHVFLQREDTRSQIKTIRECVHKLSNGASMFFFPEGTRSKTGQLGDFKKGAFSIAKRARVGIVPITVMGTGDVMPPGREFRVFHSPGVNLVVHPIISAEEVQGSSDDELMEKAERLIHSGLPLSMKGGGN